MALAASNDPLIAQAEALLAKRQPGSAYNLLAPLEDERGGTPDFDYVLGVAALDSGRASEAAFAFERCLAVEPHNGPCRVQMARAHMALGENSSARSELQTIQESQPPVEVQNMVAQYLGAINQREVSEKRQVGAWAQLGFGWDNNVNSATADGNVIFPALPGMVWTLNPAGVQQDDTFLQGGAGASLSYKLSPSLRLLADASVSTRGYQDWDQFSNLVLDGGLGLSWREGHNSVLAKLQQQGYDLDNERYRNYTGLLAQYQHALSETAAFSAYVQGSQLDYRGRRADATRYTLGGGYSQALADIAYAPVFYAGLYGGTESADGNHPEYDQDFYGLRLGGSFSLSHALSYTGSFSVERRQYGAPSNLFFLSDRKDTQFDLSLGAIWQLAPHVSLRPAYTYTLSNSNETLSDYDRHVVNVDFRYEL